MTFKYHIDSVKVNLHAKGHLVQKLLLDRHALVNRNMYWSVNSLETVSLLLPTALRATQTCRYLVYSEADFEVFCPAGATRWVKFGIKEGTEGPLLQAKFHHPTGATTRV